VIGDPVLKRIKRNELSSPGGNQVVLSSPGGNQLVLSSPGGSSGTTRRITSRTRTSYIKGSHYSFVPKMWVKNLSHYLSKT